MFFTREILIQLCLLLVVVGNNPFDEGLPEYRYGSFSEKRRLEMLDVARNMFYFGYDNYMKYAFPKDELDPIHCTGRGPDYDNPSNINVNDVLGDYALTLVDALDTLAIMGNCTEFKRAVLLIIEHVSFDKPSTVQVFEATIRVLGALVSAHLILIDPRKPFGNFDLPQYDNELLHMAHDLAVRMMPAFEGTATGIPYPRVNLQTGVSPDCINETCTAGAGSLLLEFGVLSHLLGDPIYELVARKAVERLWSFRSNVTGLFGNVINIQTGEWVGRMSGVGAGLDSFYEYLLKSFILFGDKEDLTKFNDIYGSIKYYLRRGRKDCNNGTGFPPIYVNVNMKDGEIFNYWIDSLQAAWPAVQVLHGDIEEAICSHALYYAIWKKYGALPERLNWQTRLPEVLFYPLRPELIESTYLLYQATKNPFYLHVGKDIMESLNNNTKVQCGYATVHDVTKKESLEDRMESFFLSETCKYLYLLFDHDNHLNKESLGYIFTTEGHPLPIKKEFRDDLWLEGGWKSGEQRAAKPRTKNKKKKSSVCAAENTDDNTDSPEDECSMEEAQQYTRSTVQVFVNLVQFGPVVVNTAAERFNNLTESCEKIGLEKQFQLPIKSRYLDQLDAFIGVT